MVDFKSMENAELAASVSTLGLQSGVRGKEKEGVQGR
jgi:hypothetical protein